MTCIVGVETSHGVLLGGDSAAGPGYATIVRDDTKVFCRDGYAFGFTTSYRMGQLLRYSGHLPAIDTWDIDRFMATRFVDAIRDILRDGGFAANNQGQESGGEFLVGAAGRLYAVHSDYQVARASDGHNAVGCGAPFALGSLHQTRRYGDPAARERVHAALLAAEHYSGGVRAPFHFAEVAA